MPAELHAHSGGTWRRITSVYARSGGVWRNIFEVYVRNAGVWRKAFSNLIELTIAADTTLYNIKTAALATGWDGTVPVSVILTINGGVYVRATATDNYAIDTGAGWPAGSAITINNGGIIQGFGGAGGNGGGPGAATAGAAGGHAINLQYPVSINTGSGHILGGGGGGGGGGEGES